MIVLLDTDLLIFMIRGLKSPRRSASWSRAQSLLEPCRDARAAGDVVSLSAITVSELEFGARNSGNYETEIAAVRKVLAPFEVFAYDSVACPFHYGRIRDELESIGSEIGSMDLLIAAHALALDATLATNNQAHFSRIAELKCVNWLKRG